MLQRLAQIACEAFDGIALEQRGCILQAADDEAIRLCKLERQIELGDVARALQPFDHQARQLGADIGGLVVLPCEHNLEQRRMGKAALGPGDLDHLLERKVLVGLGTEHRGAHPRQQLGNAGIVRQVDAQRQRAHEEADQPLHLRARPVGARRADHHVVMAR